MNASLPSALLRLREADIVRLCGFEAATRGLELAGRQSLSHTRRTGATLQATIIGEAPLAVTAEIVEGAPHPALRWRCSRHAPTSADDSLPAAEPGCEHVAALLTVWIRAPGDFLVPAEDLPPGVASAQVPAPHPQAHPIARRRHAPPHSQPQATPSSSATLADELARSPARDLLAIARRTLGDEYPESEARARLLAALADPAHVQATLGRLDAHPRWLFGALLTLGGAITAADLETLAERLGRAPSAVQADVEALARHGLLFSVISQHTEQAARDRSWRSLAGWRIAPETRTAGYDSYALETLLQNGAAGSSPSPFGWRVERSSPRELLLALALLAHAPAPLGPFGYRGRSRAASPVDARDGPLHVAGDLLAGRLAELARAAGLEPGLARMARRLLLWAREQAPGQPLLDLARLPPDERAGALRQAFILWRETDSVAELVDLDLSGSPVRARVDPRHTAYSPVALAAENGAARRYLLSLLARARPGVWYALDDLLTFIWRTQPGFLRGRQRAFARPTWLLEWTDGDRRALHATAEDEWRAAEGVWIRALLAGPLRWWGALDIAHDTNARKAVAFRLTPLGAQFLDARDAPAHVTLPDEWGPAILLTRDHALAANPLSAGADLLAALAQWARPTSVVGGRLLYTLAPDLASAAFDHGLEPDALGERLRAVEPHAGARVAEQVVARLDGWRLQYGRARLSERVALLEARDEPTLAEALAYVPAISARTRRIGPAVALLAPGDLADLRALLARKGYQL